MLKDVIARQKMANHLGACYIYDDASATSSTLQQQFLFWKFPVRPEQLTQDLVPGQLLRTNDEFRTHKDILRIADLAGNYLLNDDLHCLGWRGQDPNGS
jgi:hypothetical protein